MIIRIPSNEVKNWLWPELQLEPGQYMEMDILWNRQPIIRPYLIINADGEPVKKFTRAEMVQMQKHLVIASEAL